MSYRVEVDHAPAYELAVSLCSYIDRRARASLELDRGWARRVRGQLDPRFAAELAEVKGKQAYLLPDLLIWQCRERRDARGFLDWLGSLSPGELYERLAPHVPEGGQLPGDLGELRDRAVRLLAAWDDQYFRHLDRRLLDGLEADAAAKRSLAEDAAPVDLVELATGGVRLEPRPGLDLVVLVPQHHFRPWNIYSEYRGLLIYLYPADVLAPAPGDPPPGLLRLTRALADPSRLRLLRFLAGGPRSFGELVAAAGLAKSTVHHHLVALRAAGLVRLHVAGDGQDRYSLRPAALAELGARLDEFFKRQ